MISYEKLVLPALLAERLIPSNSCSDNNSCEDFLQNNKSGVYELCSKQNRGLTVCWLTVGHMHHKKALGVCFSFSERGVSLRSMKVYIP
jgi:hypothetical protein